MLDQQLSTAQQQWQKADQVWELFTQRHPELGFRSGRWAFHNFLRPHRTALVQADALRLARKRHWLAHVDRFCEAAFECATGKQPASAPVSKIPPVTFPKPELPSAFVAARRVRCHGLTAAEHFRIHNDLPPETIEELLDLIEQLLELADAAREFLPALEWHSDTIAPADMERLARLQRALVRVDHGHV
jgi:hypothetical protein